MDERTKVHVTLADGTKFDGELNSAGNLIVAGGIEKSKLSQANLRKMLWVEEKGGISELTYQALRTYYIQKDGSAFIRFGDMTPVEILKSELRDENEMLEDAIAELAEIIGGVES